MEENRMKHLLSVVCLAAVAIVNEAQAFTIQEDWLFSVAYIANESTGKAGTGFFVMREVAQGKGPLFLVLNKHVLEPKDSDPAATNKEAFAVMHITKEGADGELVLEPIRITLRNKEGAPLWIGHPVPDVDVAVLRITEYVAQGGELKPKYKVGYINESDFVTDDLTKTTHLSIGDPLVVLGYPLNIVEGRSSIPVARGGVIGTPPNRKFKGKDFFLIDCSTIRGSSGSPVFVPVRPYTVSYNEQKKITTINPMETYFPKLLGVVSQTVSDWELVIRRTHTFGAPPDETSVIDTANFGLVYPARTISETLDKSGFSAYKPEK